MRNRYKRNGTNGNEFIEKLQGMCNMHLLAISDTVIVKTTTLFLYRGVIDVK